MPSEYFTPFLLMFILKVQQLNLKHSLIWKQLGKKFIRVPTFEMLEKLNWYTHSPVWPTTWLAVCPTTCLSCADALRNGRTGHSLPFFVFSVLQVCHEYFNLNILHTYYLKECMDFIQRFILIFLRICGKALLAYRPLHGQHYILSVVLCVGVMLETYESSMKTMHTPLTDVMNILMSNNAEVTNGWSCVIS